MNLIVDIGNTRVKVAVFDVETLVYNQIYDSVLKRENIEYISARYPIDRAIVSQVGPLMDYDSLFADISYKILSADLKLPIQNLYKTPATLGSDRLAAAVGAVALYPNQNNLVIDMGTCITLDFVSSHNEYLGGAIMPGISMKFKALHTFTDKLPLLTFDNGDEVDIVGDDTRSSIFTGIINGTTMELEGFVERYVEKFGKMNIIFTGGDAIYFEKRVKFPNFVNSNLLLVGLNKILNTNE
jgi:type III pantothenate kinase